MDSLIRRAEQCRGKQAVREFLAETMGTFILMVFGIGSLAQYYLSTGVFGSYLSVNISWGLGVTFGVFWSFGISGGHINPAVTITMAVFRRLPWKKVPVYLAAQSLGSFLASACIYGVYKDALDIFDGGKRETFGPKATVEIWSTYPFARGNKTISNWSGNADQIFSTMILVGTIFALTDKKNNGVERRQLPFMLGCLVWVIGMSLGLNCGYGINPARDLIPRIFTAIAGWGSGPFKAHDYWFWYPIIGQLLGGLLGGLLYSLTISFHHPEEDDRREVSNYGSIVKYDAES